MDPPIHVANFLSTAFADAVTLTRTLVGAASCSSTSNRSRSEPNSDPPPARRMLPKRSLRTSTSHLLMFSRMSCGRPFAGLRSVPTNPAPAAQAQVGDELGLEEKLGDLEPLRAHVDDVPVREFVRHRGDVAVLLLVVRAVGEPARRLLEVGGDSSAA